MMELHHGMCEYPVLLEYPVGTRSTVLHIGGVGQVIVLENLGKYINQAKDAFLTEHGAACREELEHFDPNESLFITIGVTTFEIIIEVTDRVER